MIAILLILIPLLTGLAAFFFRNEKLVRSWALFSSVVTLGISLLGLTIFSQAKYIEHQSAWMSTLGSSFSVRLDGMGQILCLLTAISFPLIFISTWHS